MRTIKNLVTKAKSVIKRIGCKIKCKTRKIQSKIGNDGERFVAGAAAWLTFVSKLALMKWLCEKILLLATGNPNYKVIEWVIKGLSLMATEIFTLEWQIDMRSALS